MHARVLIVGLAAAMLGRVPIVVVPAPLGLQSLAGASVFLAAAALMIEGKVVMDGLKTTLSQLTIGTSAAWGLLYAYKLADPSLPLTVYAGIGLGAASEELVFRGWLPETLRRWFGNERPRSQVVSILVPAFSFSLSHLLVQQHFSFERTGRVLLLLFVAAILYSAIVRLAGLGLAVLVHTLLNVMALQFGIEAERPAWYYVAGMLVAAGAVFTAWEINRRRAPPRIGHAAITIASCAVVAATLAVITGNSRYVVVVALSAACWSIARETFAIPGAWLRGLPSALSPSRGRAPPAGRR